MRASGRCVVVLFALLVGRDAQAAPEVVLRWNPLPDAVEYEVEIATDEAFTDVVARAQTEGPRFSWPGLPTRPHYWRVRCRYRWARVGPWSPTRLIDAMVGPARPRVPAEAASLETGSPIAFELDSPPGVVEHVVEIAADDAFTSIVHSATATRGRLEVASLPPGTYWWRIAGTDALGRPVPASASRTLTVVEPPPTPMPVPVPTPVAAAPAGEGAAADAAPLAVAVPVPVLGEPAAARELPGPPVPPALASAGPDAEASIGWIGGGWVHAPRVDAMLLTARTPDRTWTAGVSAGWYARRGRTGGALLTVDVLPLAAVARWRPRERAWIGGAAGVALVSTHLASDGAHADALHAVPFLAPAIGVERDTPRGVAGAQLSWSHLPVHGRVSGDAGGVSVTFSWRTGAR